MLSLLFVALLAALIKLGLGQCTTPDFFGSTEIVAVGQRLFDQVVGESCASGIITGAVYLYKPKDPLFKPVNVGYWNGLNDSATSNTILAPALKHHGYGFRVTIVPDRESPTSTPQTSPTFTIVTQTWFDASFDQIGLIVPGYYTTQWNNDAEQLLAWQIFTGYEQPVIESFSIYLYNSNDLSWGPLLVVPTVTGVDCQCEPYSFVGTYEYYIRYPGGLPLGSGYQIVLTNTTEETGKVIAVTGLIDIVSSPVTTNTFPYPNYTPFFTLDPKPTASAKWRS